LVLVPKAARTMAGLAVAAAFSVPGALMRAISSNSDNHPDLLGFTMLTSFWYVVEAAKKKSLSHGDLRIAPSFLILR
jgi:ABC-type cobalamin transport system permease subunit